MSLEKWVEYGWLEREPTSPDEIQGLLSIVERGLADSKVEAISTDLRFIAAFNSALTAATVALRANGYRAIVQLVRLAIMSKLSTRSNSRCRRVVGLSRG